MILSVNLGLEPLDLFVRSEALTRNLQAGRAFHMILKHFQEFKNNLNKLL